MHCKANYCTVVFIFLQYLPKLQSKENINGLQKYSDMGFFVLFRELFSGVAAYHDRRWQVTNSVTAAAALHKWLCAQHILENPGLYHKVPFTEKDLQMVCKLWERSEALPLKQGQLRRERGCQMASVKVNKIIKQKKESLLVPRSVHVRM